MVAASLWLIGTVVQILVDLTRTVEVDHAAISAFVASTTLASRSSLSNSTMCENHPKCKHLSGECCPTPSGIKLGCCTLDVPLSLAACASHETCVGVTGNCCPTDDGVHLACCDSTVTGHDPPPRNHTVREKAQLDFATRYNGTARLLASVQTHGFYANHYESNNPLRIIPDEQRSSNYFLVIGDWGRAGGPGLCQEAVAEKMKKYVAQQSSLGKKLLFIASVGDNFYWTGVTKEAWGRSWSDPYGSADPTSPLFQVPWLVALGNHDFGDHDPFAFCPYAQAQAMASFAGQPYGSLQLNMDKNPSRPVNTAHFWLPDYNYHYEIPELELEVIAIDTNVNGLFELGGDWHGHGESFNICGGIDPVADFLGRVGLSGRLLVQERARVGTAKTVLIIQHYPGLCHRDVFEEAMPKGRKVNVVCAYGHIHAQRCDRVNSAGICDTILTGGGGGCCAPDVAYAGFTAVRLTNDGGFISDVTSPSVRMPYGICGWSRRLATNKTEEP